MPDSEVCTASTKAWLPDVQDCDDGTGKCTLKLKPDVETQLEKLSIWFASVAVESAGIEGLHSPSTIYSYDMSVCGDGKRSKDEQCDDRNLNDGDGCSQNCLAEEKFHCVKDNKLSSSVCYIYEGDGECEPFEWDGYNKDCNNITASTLHSQYYPASIYAYSTILQKNCSLQFLSCATLTTGGHLVGLHVLSLQKRVKFHCMLHSQVKSFQSAF